MYEWTTDVKKYDVEEGEWGHGCNFEFCSWLSGGWNSNAALYPICGGERLLELEDIVVFDLRSQ